MSEQVSASDIVDITVYHWCLLQCLIYRDDWFNLYSSRDFTIVMTYIVVTFQIIKVIIEINFALLHSLDAHTLGMYVYIGHVRIYWTCTYILDIYSHVRTYNYVPLKFLNCI